MTATMSRISSTDGSLLCDDRIFESIFPPPEALDLSIFTNGIVTSPAASGFFERDTLAGNASNFGSPDTMRSSAVASPNSIRLSPRTPTKNLEDFVGSKRENIIKKLTKDSPESLESPYNSTSQRPSLASKLSQPVGDKQRNPAFYHRKDRSRVKGENLPFLVASGRETTSSRGSDNTLLPQKRTNKQASSTKRVARPAGTEDKAVPATHPGQNNAVTSLSRPVRTQDFSDAIPNLQDETPSTSYGFPRRPISSEWPAYNEASVHATQQPSHGNNTTLTGDIYENSIMETVEDNLWTSRVEPGYKRAGSSPSSIYHSASSGTGSYGLGGYIQNVPPTIQPLMPPPGAMGQLSVANQPMGLQSSQDIPFNSVALPQPDIWSSYPPQSMIMMNPQQYNTWPQYNSFDEWLPGNDFVGNPPITDLPAGNSFAPSREQQRQSQQMFDMSQSDWTTPSPHQSNALVVRRPSTTFQRTEPIHVAKPSKRTRSPGPNRSTAVSKRSTKLDVAWPESTAIKELPEGRGLMSIEKPVRRGGKTGSLEPEVRKATHEMRVIHACFNCRLRNIKCDKNERCAECTKHLERSRGNDSQRLPMSFCCRKTLKDCVNFFTAACFLSRYDMKELTQAFDSLVADFDHSRQFIACVTTSQFYTPMQILVHEFKPKDTSLLLETRLDEESGTIPRIVKVHTPPFAVNTQGVGRQYLENILYDHYEQQIRNWRNEGERLWGFTSELSWDCLEAVNSYYKATFNANKEDRDLKNACMLYAMMYGAMVDFALDSDYIDSAMQNLKRPFRFNYSPNCSVGLLDLQLKEALAGLLRKQVEICLSRLHTLMMKQTEDSWGPAVAYIIILCLCGEMVPVSVDYRLVREALEKGVEVVREDTVEIMRNIYDQPIRIMVELFHASFATHRAKKGEKGKEPVKLFVEMNARTNCAPALKKFVLELKEVQWKHDPLLPEYARKRTVSLKSDDPLQDHFKYRNETSGSLCALFLMSLSKKIQL